MLVREGWLLLRAADRSKSGLGSVPINAPRTRYVLGGPSDRRRSRAACATGEKEYGASRKPDPPIHKIINR